MAMLTSSSLSFTPRRRGNLLKTLLQFTSVARQRRALAALDERLLNDIGVSNTQAQAEAQKPFWDAPATWHVCNPRF